MPEPREIIDTGLNALDSLDCELGEIRIVNNREEWIEVKGQEVEKLDRQLDTGFGVRVLVNGCWGYAASNSDSLPDVVECAKRAVRIARSNPGRVNPALLEQLEPQRGKYRTPVEVDYFDVSTDDKIDLLLKATEIIDKDKDVAVAKGTTHGQKRKTWFASTNGTDIEQEVSLCGGAVSATAFRDGEVQVRSYPKSQEGQYNAAGWEFIREADLVGNAERVREEAVALLDAPECPAGKKSLIIDGSQMSLQLHESCGHPSELDRVIGEEISLAGCSFLRPEGLGSFQYGSPIVNIYADSTSPGGPGTFGWDDEGVPADRWDLVKDGLLVGYLGSRETESRIPTTRAGASRADSWSKLPIVRMVNVNLAPGDCTLDEMIADTKDGLMVSVNRSWSIDDFRLNFQFSCEAGWEIKNGKLGQLVKNPIYTGITPEFWGKCDAIANQDHWQMWGWRFCGKGDPMQIISVGHGCSPARFANVEVGSSHVG